jgi:hypothetical protein
VHYTEIAAVPDMSAPSTTHPTLVFLHGSGGTLASLYELASTIAPHSRKILIDIQDSVAVRFLRTPQSTGSGGTRNTSEHLWSYSIFRNRFSVVTHSAAHSRLSRRISRRRSRRHRTIGSAIRGRGGEKIVLRTTLHRCPVYSLAYQKNYLSHTISAF